MIIADASFALHVLLRGELAAEAEILFQKTESMAAPTIIDYELLSALRRLVRAREVGLERAKSAIGEFFQMPIDRYPPQPLSERIWTLRDNATVYDASYLVLAEDLGAPLYTLDRRLAKVPGCTATVVVISPN